MNAPGQSGMKNNELCSGNSIGSQFRALSVFLSKSLSVVADAFASVARKLMLVIFPSRADSFTLLCEKEEQTLPVTDICSQYQHLCPNARCIATPGSYRCECHTGFRRDKDNCIGEKF